MTKVGRRIITALVLGGLVLTTGWGLWAIRPVLAPFLMAIVIAYLVAPLVNGLTRWGLSRGWAILVVYLGLALLGVLGVAKVLPRALVDLQRLGLAIPAYSVRARELVDGLQQRVRDMGVPHEVRDMLDRQITGLEVRSVAALNSMMDAQVLGRVAGLLVALLLAPFLAFYLLKDLDRFKERFIHALPRPYRTEILSLLRGLDRVISGFVRGQLLLALIIGMLSALATALLGLRYSLLLGIWAGLTEMVPYVGPILGAIPAVLAGFSTSPLRALQVTLAFAIIQQLENAVLAPKIMGESVGLHPLVVMMSVLAGGYLLGTWGLVLALPIAGVIRVLWGFLIARLTEVRVESALARPVARPEPSTVTEKARPD